MNFAKQIIRQTASLRLATRTFSFGPLAVRCMPRVSQCSTGRPAPALLQPQCVASQTKLVCRDSSTQQCKFEVINVQDEEDFKKRVLESGKPVVVDFHATWCGPCKLLGPRLEKLLSDGDSDVIMAKVDIDDNSDLAMEYGVRSVPTVLGMKGGKVTGQFVGLIDDDQIQTFVDKLVVS